MPASPQFRFLLRGSSLFIVLLTLWWLVLLGPLLTGLRFATGVALWLLPGGGSASGAIVAPNGDWVLRVPIPQFVAKKDAVQRAYGRAPGAQPVNVRSFRLAIPERTPTFFTLGFPMFWALMLAAPYSRVLWRALGLGTALLALIAVLSLLLYSAFTISTNLHLATEGLTAILWSAAEYLNLNVVQYTVPLLIAPWLHPGLRAQIFSWGEAILPPPAPIAEPEKPRRGRFRGK